jgi:4-alpha-glucanotransferase
VFNRASGVLLHPTSLPGPHGVGDLGEAAFRFVDWLQIAGQQYWQVLPLVPIGPGNSPYSSVSAFAGNPLLISLPGLVEEGLLNQRDLDHAPVFSDHRVDYDRATEYKGSRLRAAYDRFRAHDDHHLRAEFSRFLDRESVWIHDFTLFMAVKAAHKLAGWTQWEPEIAVRAPAALERWSKELAEDVEFFGFEQFLFRRQWRALKHYANERGVRLIGDIPIFVAHDSADVWANQTLFRLKRDGQPAVVAGVPPDYYSETGQLWGNPHYDWGAIAATGYKWWVDRFRELLSLVDVIRIDHFRGFAAAWVVPAGETTAAAGRWEQGPGRQLFDAIRIALGEVPIIVEDLGLITRDVKELRRDLGLPGMAVLQFAFNGKPENSYLPHNYDDQIVVYPGTHDNETTAGWFRTLDEQKRQQARTYLGRDGSDIAWDLLRAALASTAKLAIVTMQDILRLDDSARMNTPGVALGNWSWRFLARQMDPGLAAGLALLVQAYGREGGVRPPATTDDYDYTAPNTEHPLHR